MAPFSLGFTEKQLISALLFVSLFIFPHRVYDHVALWLLLVDAIHSQQTEGKVCSDHKKLSMFNICEFYTLASCLLARLLTF